MAEIGVWRGSRAAAGGACRRGARGGWWAVQLWAWLHAQELLAGPAGGAAFAEDDWRRLAGYRATPADPAGELWVSRVRRLPD
jgi:hypothetical protein